MKVYKVTGRVPYGTALAIVAANNPRQAEKTIKQEDDTWIKFIANVNATCLRGVSSTATRAKVLTQSVYIE